MFHPFAINMKSGHRGIYCALVFCIMIVNSLRAQELSCPEDMVFVPAGEFIMGSGEEAVAAALEACEKNWGAACRKEWFEAETPPRRITLEAFCIQRNEVTQAEYESLMGDNPSHFRECGPECPVENVTRDNAAAYCEKLGARLPTEAQWEKAARGNGGGKYAWGSTTPECVRSVWGNNEQGCGQRGPAPVGQRPDGASPAGALDMAGNVMEWVRDCYGDDWYERMPDTNPLNDTGDCTHGVVRGGGWNSPAWALRTAARTPVPLTHADSLTGFRCVTDAQNTDFQGVDQARVPLRPTFDALCEKLTGAAMAMDASGAPETFMEQCLDRRDTIQQSLGGPDAFAAYLKVIMASCAGLNGDDWYACYEAALPAAEAAAEQAVPIEIPDTNPNTYQSLCDRLVRAAQALNVGTDADTLRADCLDTRTMLLNSLGSEEALAAYITHIMSACSDAEDSLWYDCYIAEQEGAERAAGRIVAAQDNEPAPPEHAPGPGRDYSFVDLCDRLVEETRAASHPADELSLADVRNVCMGAQGDYPDPVAFVNFLMNACVDTHGADWLNCYSSAYPEAEAAARNTPQNP